VLYQIWQLWRGKRTFAYVVSDIHTFDCLHILRSNMDQKLRHSLLALSYFLRWNFEGAAWQKCSWWRTAPMSAAEVMMKAWQNIGHGEVISESAVKGEKYFWRQLRSVLEHVHSKPRVHKFLVDRFLKGGTWSFQYYRCSFAPYLRKYVLVHVYRAKCVR